MIPRAMKPHRMLVEDYRGSTATGPVYGPPRTVRCYVEAKSSSVRSPEGRTVAAAAVIRCDLDRSITPESRITVFGHRCEIVSVAHYDFPGAPSHTEVTVQ